ncbi:MAG: hypothetical protein ACREDC_08240 [Bradyrhizobium sp.]
MAGFREAARAVADHAKRKAFNPGGTPGKLHRELGVPVGKKIPPKKLATALHSKNREVRDDAIRAKTMEGWHHK